ncbi:MAG: amino acid adenylation domain-containing protein [Lachnospiraceae bacterium]|jgi:amino acid adenylation domain-containing protein
MENEKYWSDQLAADPDLFRRESLIGIFRKVAACQPDRPAVVCENASLTYRELDRMSDQAARKLASENLKPGSAVAVMAGRSVETVIGILGIWKCGCVYLFLDRKYPAQRNRECMEECATQEVITPEWIQEAVEEESDEPFEERGEKNRLAAIVYTSGSTSRPKGVLLTNRNILTSVSNYKELGITGADRYACFASMMFVASLFDLCVSLLTGACLYLIPAEIRKSIKSLAKYYRDNRITVTFLPPHMAVKYAQCDEGSPLKVLICGSESARNLRSRSYRIAHVYASTEACAIVSIYWIKDSRSHYPAGKLVPTIRAWVVDKTGKPVPAGVSGELWLSGPQICAGYLKLPEKNHASFIQNPFTREPGYEIIYKTGDSASIDRDGTLNIFGRQDDMVKVRGFRIELTAVENCMMRFPTVEEACCKAFCDKGGENILIGYYTANGEVNHDQLREYIGRNLPYYMIPSALIRLDEMPRSANYKIDRSALKAPAEINDYKLLSKKYH